MSKGEIEVIPTEKFREWQELEKTFQVIHKSVASKKLTHGQKLAAYALADGWEDEDIARFCKITTKTLNRWIKNKDFQKFRQGLDLQNVAMAQKFFQSKIPTYARIIHDVATNASGDVRPETQLQAAKKAMEAAEGRVDADLTISIRQLYERKLEKSGD